MRYDVVQTRTVEFHATVEASEDEALEFGLESVLRTAAFEEILEAFGDGTDTVIIDYLTLDGQRWEEIG